MKKLFTFLSLIISINCFGQIEFQEHLISDNVENAQSVFASDLDGDGKIDVLSSSFNNNKISWYKNTDGQGNFGQEQIISTLVTRAKTVIASDIDGDGDMDVLAASSGDNNIIWFKNINGFGDFNEQEIISSTTDRVHAIFAVNIDKDDDIDILAIFGTQVVWYKNTNGLGDFSTMNIITTSAHSAQSVFPIDIDGDGDMDVLATASGPGKAAWYKNTDGQGNFEEHQIILPTPERLFAQAVSAADMDGDGDIDVLVNFGIQLAWFENLDGLGNFGQAQIISEDANFLSAFTTEDIDGDGDMDILSAADVRILLHENNNGLGSFKPFQTIGSNTEVVSSFFTIDIDSDGDLDILSASRFDNKIAWHENLKPNAVHHIPSINFSIYPNPTTNTLYINSETKTIQIEIYNNLGQLVLATTNQNNINITKLVNGLYFCKVKDVNGDFGIRKVVKE